MDNDNVISMDEFREMKRVFDEAAIKVGDRRWINYLDTTGEPVCEEFEWTEIGYVPVRLLDIVVPPDRDG